MPQEKLKFRAQPTLNGNGLGQFLQRWRKFLEEHETRTVLESLAQGVPQLAIPVTFEQPGVAARKTGVTMSFADLTSKRLATLLEEVLTQPIYRENARKFQEIIGKRNGLAMAADIIERAFGVNTKSN